MNDRDDATAMIEIRGLTVYTHHGITAAEQEVGQRLVIDATIEAPECDAMLTDRIEDTVDYAEIADLITLAATERSYATLERLCRVIAERIAERSGSTLVRVRAAKPEPPLPLALDEVAVEIVYEGNPADDDEDE